jgi:hypothetical protein
MHRHTRLFPASKVFAKALEASADIQDCISCHSFVGRFYSASEQVRQKIAALSAPTLILNPRIPR